MTYYIGIDPGTSGGIAILLNGELKSWIKMPTVKAQKNPFAFPAEGGIDISQVITYVETNSPEIGEIFVAGEKVNGIKGQSASASFNFGVSTASVYAVIYAVFSRFQDTPKFEIYHKLRWGPNVGLRPGSDKKASVAKALELWPNAGDLGKGKFTDGPAEAALIAYFAYLKNTKGL